MLNDIRYALRLLRRSPGFTTAAVLTLALGIGANTAIYSVLQAVWLDAAPFFEPSRLVMLSSANDQWKTMSVSDEDFMVWGAQNTVFESLAASDAGGSLRVNDQLLTARWASPDLFATLNARMGQGRPLVPADGRPDAPIVGVLSYEAWQRRLLGDAGIVGRTFNSKMGPVEIVGVAPPDFKLSAFTPAIWVSKKLTPPQPGRAGARSLEVVGRLKPGLTLEDAHEEMNRIAVRLAEQHPANARYPAVTLTPIREKLAGPGVGESLWLLLGATAVVLLIACANIANLFLARGASRRRELAVRAVLGARAGHIVRQVFTESALVALAGTFAGILLTLWVRDALIAAMPDNLHRSSQISIDARVLGFTVVAGVISALLTGLLPAMRGSLMRPADLLVGTAQYGATRTRRRLSAGLVGAEVALAVVVLSIAGLLVSSFVKLRAVDPGFAPEGLLTFTIAPDAARSNDEKGGVLHRRVLAALATIPQLQKASAGEMLPLSGNRSRYGFRVVDGPRAAEGRSVDLDLRWVDANYFDVMGIPVKEGRGFTAAGNPPGGVLINERAARELWPGVDSILGRQFFNGNSRSTVIGVVGDVRHVALDADPVSEVYYLSGGTGQLTYVARTAGSPAALERTVRETVEAAAPVKLTDFSTFDEMVTHSVRVPQFRARLFSLMGLLVAALAMVGVFSVTAYAVAERQREIGIRMALGARPARTVRFMLAQASVPVVIGLVVGLTAAFNTNRLVAHFLFATTPRDPLTVSAVILGVFLTAMLAAYIPARRVLRVDPTTALRAE